MTYNTYVAYLTAAQDGNAFQAKQVVQQMILDVQQQNPGAVITNYAWSNPDAIGTVQYTLEYTTDANEAS